MSKEIFVAFATQKGGIGKSTVTALAASWKSHSTLTLLATQNYPFLLKYDCPLWLK